MTSKQAGIGWDDYASTHPGRLTDLVSAYRSGDADWPTTKAALVGFGYSRPPETPEHYSPRWYQAVEDKASLSDGPDTVDHLQEIQAFGGITRKELDEVFNEWQAQHEGTTS